MTNPMRSTTTMTTPTADGTPNGSAPTAPHRPTARRVARRLSTETKSAFKTTEFWVYVAVVIGILIASQVVGSDSHATTAGSGGNAGDYFRANTAWLYIVLATIGYLLSRGLAKAGSRDYYDDQSDDDNS
jgi:hypothetical protein